MTMEFNKQQTNVINSINGPIMVISCAGSGKTSVIIERSNKIIQSGIASNKILVVTFSKAAATEMEERFKKKYGNINVKFSTIHSLCYSILLNAYELNPASILKASEKRAFLKEKFIDLKKKYGKSFEEHYKGIDDFYKDMDLKISGYMIMMYKNNIYNYDEVINDEYVKSIYASYLKFKKVSGKIDFDDMIIESHKCLKVKSEILLHWQSVFEYIMIDEYQDTNIIQAEIFFMLAGGKKNICVVGDDDQSIYSFRDTDSLIFNKFLDMYPNAKKIFLETNYRSKPMIINLASNLISHNSQRFTKKFLSSKTGDSKVKIVAVENNIGQADDVIKIIENYRKQNVPLNTIAILYRVKKEARFLCNRLQVEKIPFFTKELPESLHNGMVFGDIKAYYRLANDLWGSTDLQRIINRPKRYIKFEVIGNCSLNKEEILQRCLKGIQYGDRKEQIFNTVEQLFVDLRELRGKKPVDFMKYLLVNMKYREALVEHADFIKIDSRALTDDFDELINEAAKFNTMAEWDSYATECRNRIIKEMEKNKEEGIYLSTFHSSKGLEWDNVIIISANDGVTPLMRKEEIENPEEERRLFYVAMTRAKEELSVLYTACEDNKAKGVLPSRYISEMKTKNKG